MKKTILTICALLAAGTACIAGCSNGQTNKDTKHTGDDPAKIIVEEDIGDEKNCPDGKCPKDVKRDDMHKGGKTKDGAPRVKPNFRFEPPAESAPEVENEKEFSKEKAPENSKGSFGKKRRRFDSKFKEPKPEHGDKDGKPEEHRKAPDTENDGNVEPKDD